MGCCCEHKASVQAHMCRSHKTRMRLEKSEDYKALYSFFAKNELEVDDEGIDPVETEIVKGWVLSVENASAPVSKCECEHENNKTIAGGVILARRENCYIIDGIAIDPAYRGQHLGAMLLKKAIDEVKSLGGDTLYLVARTPEFFKTQGFVAIERGNAPQFFECFSCDQYQKTCHPEVLKLMIG